MEVKYFRVLSCIGREQTNVPLLKVRFSFHAFGETANDGHCTNLLVWAFNKLIPLYSEEIFNTT